MESVRDGFDGLNPILHDHANREGRENPYPKDEARIYQPREFTGRFNDSPLIQPPLIKGVHRDLMFPYGIDY